jgi:hypothetical protein
MHMRYHRKQRDPDSSRSTRAVSLPPLAFNCRIDECACFSSSCTLFPRSSRVWNSLVCCRPLVKFRAAATTSVPFFWMLFFVRHSLETMTTSRVMTTEGSADTDSTSSFQFISSVSDSAKCWIARSTSEQTTITSISSSSSVSSSSEEELGGASAS